MAKILRTILITVITWWLTPALAFRDRKICIILVIYGKYLSSQKRKFAFKMDQSYKQESIKEIMFFVWLSSVDGSYHEDPGWSK